MISRVARARWAVPVLIALCPAAASADARPPIRDGVALNIGLNCQWQKSCMARQERAMKRALDFVKKKRPAAWRIQTCNRNASRGRYRVDWVGFDNCIRNASLRPAPQRVIGKRNRKLI
jgi:hypothetical protein